MMNRQVIHQLLSRWQVARDQGRNPSPEQLCCDHPELVDEVRRQIQVLCTSEPPRLPPTSSAVTNASPPPGAFSSRPQVPGYEIVSELGRSETGVVFKAIHHRLKRTVALKLILARAYAGAAQKSRFLSDAGLAANLQHPHIVQVVDLGEEGGLPFVALEFIEGGSLARRLDGTPFTPRSAARLLLTLARAVHVAHQAGVVHGDLKPAHVLLMPDGTPKIADFGLARQANPQDPEEGEPRAAEQVLGSPAYIAPEQALGKHGHVGPRSDIHALGVILYELLTGRVPFKGTTPKETVEQVVSQAPCPPTLIQPRVPRDLEAICLKCLHKDPARRYASARELAADLDLFLEGLPIQAGARSWPQRAWLRCRDRLGVGVSRQAILLAMALVFVGVFWQWQRAETRANAACRQLALAEEAALRALNEKEQAEESERRMVLQKERAERGETAARSGLEASRLAVALGSKVMDQQGTALCDSPDLKGRGLERARKELLGRTAEFHEQFLGMLQVDDPGLQAEGAQACLRVARLRAEIDTPSRAIDACYQGVQGLERLHQRHPEQPQYQRQLADAYRQLALLYLRNGQRPESQRVLERGLELAGGAILRAPEAPAAFQKARCLILLGKLHWEEGRHLKAEEAWVKVCHILETLVQAHPHSPEYLEELAQAWANRSLAFWARQQSDEAIQGLEKMRALREQLVLVQGSSALVRDSLATADFNLGSAYQRVKQLDKVEEAWARCLTARRQLVQQHPLVQEYRNALAGVASSLGLLHAQTRTSQEAGKLYREALAVYEELVRTSPQAAPYQVGFARTATQLGELLDTENQFTESLSWHSRALELLEDVRTREPNDPAALTLLLKALSGRSEALVNLSRHREAVVSWEKFLSLAPPETQPLVRLRLATSLAQTGDHARAVRQVNVMAENLGGKARGDLCYQAALAYSLAAQAVRNDHLLGEVERDQRVTAYLDQAIRLLESPAGVDFLRQPGRARSVKTHANWEALRGHDAYAKLLQRVAAKP